MTIPKIFLEHILQKKIIMGVVIDVMSSLDLITFKNPDINLFQAKQAYNLYYYLVF